VNITFKKKKKNPQKHVNKRTKEERIFMSQTHSDRVFDKFQERNFMYKLELQYIYIYICMAERTRTSRTSRLILWS
jgi:hypothetical protein